MLTPPTTLILTPLQIFEDLELPTFVFEILTLLILTHYKFEEILPLFLFLIIVLAFWTRFHIF